MSVRLKSGDIAKLLNGECTDNSILINNFSSLAEAKKDSISFYSDVKYKNYLNHTKAGVIILKKKRCQFNE